MSVQGKTIVITGVSSGIGSDTAKLLRQQGARVPHLEHAARQAHRVAPHLGGLQGGGQHRHLG
jgi:NADP-dependent 3-hydroxy acid dehydrogenase YdfG